MLPQKNIVTFATTHWETDNHQQEKTMIKTGGQDQTRTTTTTL